MIRIFGLLCLSSFVYVNGQHDHKVNVTVYYESLCPDSIAFVTKQLYPALQMDELKQHVNLSLIPYGKSNTTRDGVSLEFSCHHGPAECYGNKIHACALRKIPPTSDGENKVAMDFINCVMANVNTGDGNLPVGKCTENTEVRNKADIENCAKSHEGSQLLEFYGQRTQAFQDHLDSVPTIVFDNTFKRDDSIKAQEDFVATLCKYIVHDKPAECDSKNGAELNAKSFAIGLIIAFLASRVF